MIGSQPISLWPPFSPQLGVHNQYSTFVQLFPIYFVLIMFFLLAMLISCRRSLSSCSMFQKKKIIISFSMETIIILKLISYNNIIYSSNITRCYNTENNIWRKDVVMEDSYFTIGVVKEVVAQ